MTPHAPRQGIPLRPAPGELERQERAALCRSLAAVALGGVEKVSPQQILHRPSWHDDFRTTQFLKAATSPIDTTAGAAAGLAQTRVGPLLLVAPGSAAAQLFERCARFDFTGVHQFFIPHVATHPRPIFVPEGGPTPIVQGALANAQIGPTRRLAFGVGLTRELNESTPETASVVLGRLLGESAALSLDTVVFDNNPASPSRPAGLLNGVTPLTASPAAGTILDTITADISKLAGAFGTASINSANMVLIAHPVEAWRLRLSRGFEDLGFSVLMTLGLAPGTVVAAIPEALASGYDGAPQIETSHEGELHYEDTLPLQIVSGSPAVVASPVRELFQTDSLAVKCRVRCAWASLQPGAVQYMTSVNW